MWDIPMKKRNIRYEKNTDGDFSAVDGWTFSKQKCEEHQKGNHLQQSPLLKWELVRLGQPPPSNPLQQSPQAKGELIGWGQQLPNNYLQQLPQAKGELPGDCWESVFEKILTGNHNLYYQGA